jgi:uncharacterized protein YjbI with pentapeptide repeats
MNNHMDHDPNESSVKQNGKQASNFVRKSFQWMKDHSGFYGYVDTKGDYHRGKTLWDWLQLLIVPIVLATAALWFNHASQRNLMLIEEDRSKEDVLQDYFSGMENLILNNSLIDARLSDNAVVLDIARAKTITVLRVLDEPRQSAVFQFLRDSGLSDFLLINATMRKMSFDGCDISHVNLTEAEMNMTSFVDASLMGASLNQAYLIEADMRRAILDGAKMERAILTDANLSRAYLIVTDLSGAYMRGVNLSDAIFDTSKLNKADLRNANLNGADLFDTDLSGAKILGTDLRNTNLNEAHINLARYDSLTKWPKGYDYINSGAIGPKASLVGANLSGLILDRLDLQEANLERVNLSGSTLSGSNLYLANMSGADLSWSYLDGANLKVADLSEANLTNAKLMGADLTGANLAGADLSGANLEGAIITEDQIKSVKSIDGVIMPDGKKYVP